MLEPPVNVKPTDSVRRLVRSGDGLTPITEVDLRFAAAQLIGSREQQEDDFAIVDFSDDRHERLLFVVADGMGGHVGAAEAAKSAVRHFCESAEKYGDPLLQRLRPALDTANSSLAILAARDPTFEGAGCTLLAASIDDGELSWVSVGDSSLLLFREGKLRKLNEDHSMRPVFSEFVRAGRMRTDAAKTNPRRNALRSALTGGDLKLIDQPPAPIKLMPGDQLILASDGLETLSDLTIATILRRASALEPLGVIHRLLKAIKTARKRDQDNTTIVLYCGNPDFRRRQRRDLANTAFRWIRRAVILLCVALIFMAVRWLQISSRCSVMIRWSPYCRIYQAGVHGRNNQAWTSKTLSRPPHAPSATGCRC